MASKIWSAEGKAPAPKLGGTWKKTGKSKRNLSGVYEDEWEWVPTPVAGSVEEAAAKKEAGEPTSPPMQSAPVDVVQQEYAPLQGAFRGALQDLVKDPTQARQQAQYRLGRQVGAQAAQLQRAATRGGAAGRGGGTGVVTAPAAEMAVRGQQELETQMYDRQVQNMAALGQTLAQTVQSDLSVRGFDQQTQANAINIMQNALGLVAERLGDTDFHPIVSQAYNRYKEDIAKGIPPIQAAMTFSLTLQSGTTAQVAQV